MITVYAEANLVLELAYSQEEATDCLEIVKEAEGGRIRLAIPVLAFFEPLYKWRGQSQDRESQASDWRTLATELHRRNEETAQKLENQLLQSVIDIKALVEVDRQQIEQATVRLLKSAEVLELQPTYFSRALAEKSLKPADALVLVTVLDDADQQGTKAQTDELLFFTRDDRGFKKDPSASRRLKQAGVRVISNAKDTVARVRALLSQR